MFLGIFWLSVIFWNFGGFGVWVLFPGWLGGFVGFDGIGSVILWFWVRVERLGLV